MLRAIKDDLQFKAERDQFLHEVSRGDEILEGIEWIVTRFPKCGYESRHRPVWYLPLDTIPPYWFFYSFDSEIVYFLNLIPAYDTNGHPR